MLQRFVTAAALLYGAVTRPHETTQLASLAPLLMDACAAMLLVFGLWTPVVGAVVACRELWIVFSGGDP